MINSLLTHGSLAARDDMHLVTWPDSSLLQNCEIGAALTEALRQQAAHSLADCAFGCAPFGRVTVVPESDWLDGLTQKLAAALRGLCRKTACPHLVLDTSRWDMDDKKHRAIVISLLHNLFNLEYQVSDLGYKKPADRAVRLSHLTLWCLPHQEHALSALLTQTAACAKGMIAARRLADRPSEHCTPAFMVSDIVRQAEDYPQLRCDVLDENQIQQHGLGLLHAVGKGASNPPRLLVIHYDGCDEGPFGVYVGKGITFDTGGLWLKSGEGMYTMKYDMCGAANVFGLLVATAELKLPVRLVGVLALAENMPGPDAMRPGEIATSYSGLSVEINNTDAEGRLVLADAIAWAAALRKEQQPPHYIIDMATLTGAVVKALGYDITGLWSNDSALTRTLSTAAEHSGDSLWPMPLDARFAPQVESRIADICNTPTNNAAISTSAAWFLNRFCPAEIPWAHLDISGTALWREQGYSVASGRPVPLLIQHLLETGEVK
ncbi:leucyl aminopeptidase family protein [Atlantibacter sp.]|uniref:leucyl aminopeptidase family protein n=1 Tax=Atlantibacter sp. TaxID=1903473 RepID=UPI0028A9DFFB|nr:leucyl aminopeptidase family protein [Atlantibacter sp.]